MNRITEYRMKRRLLKFKAKDALIPIAAMTNYEVAIDCGVFLEKFVDPTLPTAALYYVAKNKPDLLDKSLKTLEGITDTVVIKSVESLADMDQLEKVLNIYDKHTKDIRLGNLAEALVKTKEYCVFDRILESEEENYDLYSIDRVYHTISVIAEYGDEITISSFMDTVEKVKEHTHFNQMIDTIINYSHNKRSKSDIENYVAVVGRYSDYFKEMNKLFETIKETDFAELLVKRNYQAIVKSDNPIALIEKLLTSNHSMYRGEILDIEFREEANYEDLDILRKSYKTVMEIHSERKNKQRMDIIAGYYEQLNRAISQGNNLQNKRKYFRRYCAEVSRKIIENASDLMVITDGS